MTSIRRRILLPLVPLIGLTLALTALAIYGAVRRDLVDGLDRTLLVLARGVGSSVDVELGGHVEFEREEVEALAFPRNSADAFYVLREDDGGVVAGSVSPAPGPFAGDPERPIFSLALLAGREFRVCTLPVVREPEQDAEDRRDWEETHPGAPLPEPEARRFWVTVGHSTDGVHATLATLRNRLALGCAGLFLVLAALPAWAVSRGLRSLSRISVQADRVGPQEPNRRLSEIGVDREVRPLVAALNRALDRLSAAYARQKRFTADAAHELRTPLSALRAHCEVALRKPRDAAEVLSTLRTVHDLALRLGDLVERLLALSRLERDGSDLPLKDLDLVQTARDVLQVHEPEARAKGVRLELRAAGRVPVRGDAVLLAECLSNLLGNAVRYTPAGGSVVVEATSEPHPCMAVQDTGIGIPGEHLETIFDRFHRVDRARSRHDGGHGLGLAIAQEIAHLHGGEITVRSQPGAGSRFEVHLPTEPGPACPPSSVPPPGAAPPCP